MKTKFEEWLEKKGYSIKETTFEEDGTTVKEQGTTPNELAGYYNEYNAEKREEFEAAIKEENEEAIKSIREEWEENKQGQAEMLTKLIKGVGEMGIELKNIKEKSSTDVSLVKGNRLVKALGEVSDQLKTIKTDNTRDEIQFKVAGDMTFANSITGEIPLEQRESGVNRISRVKTRIKDLVNSGIATSNLITWVEFQNPDGSVGGTVEGVTKNQIDFDLIVNSESVKKRTGLIKVSTEMLDDIDFIRTEIETELFEQLDLDVDDQVLQGDNIGQNLNGILTQATAFAAGVFALTVDEANLVDVLTVARNQVVTANFMPTSHVANPTDVTALRLLKATDNQYVDRLITVAGTLTLDGVPVVEHNGMPQDNFLTMDGSKGTVFSKGELTINIGLDGNDFSKNMRTIIAEWRGLFRIKGNDIPAFVTGVISTSKTALETL